MFKYLYWLLGLLLYIIAIPILLYKKRSPRYQETIPARFFLKNNPSFTKKGIWFHSCSLGETKGLQPIIDRLPQETINMSVVTNTAFSHAHKMTKDEVRYLPFELFLPFWITPQKALIVTEAEYWYLLFLVAKAKGAKTMLINARISDKHYASYQKYNWFYTKIFSQIDIIFAQSQRDKERLETLGVKEVIVTGNSKLVNLPIVTQNLSKPNGILIVAGSTHAPEEALILEAWEREQGRLVIVPRHPERFDEVDGLIRKRIESSNLTYHRYSQQEDFEADIVLVDKMGILINIYAISDVVILGGGFVYGSGGHNPIEVAHFGAVLITGELIYNQTSLYECIDHYYVIKNNELKEYLNKFDTLLPSRINQLGTIEPVMAYIEREIV